MGAIPYDRLTMKNSLEHIVDNLQRYVDEVGPEFLKANVELRGPELVTTTLGDQIDSAEIWVEAVQAGTGPGLFPVDGYYDRIEHIVVENSALVNDPKAICAGFREQIAEMLADAQSGKSPL